MRLHSARVINIKSFYPDIPIKFKDDINVFVGPNAGGKSNLFEILQGLLNSILFKHITLQQNQNWRNAKIPDKDKLFALVFDNPDPNNLRENILDKHFQQLDKPSTLITEFIITKEDIEQVKYIISNKEKIINLLSNQIVNSEALITLLIDIPQDINFDEFEGKTLVLAVNPDNSLNIMIADYAGYDANQQLKLNKLFEFIQYRNVFHELSLIEPTLNVHPATRYFGPHRNLGQPSSYISVDLSSIGNFEDNFAKGINQNKENTPSFIDGSFNKLCYLFKQGKTEATENYKQYLKKYLKINFEIKQVSHPTKYVYDINFTRLSGVPMKLSSGEKEFFNLISGLILTGIKDGIVLIDEPELHLHFQWQQTILNLIKELSKDFNIQFLIVTHSPKLINIETLPRLYRVYMQDDLTSRIIEPNKQIVNVELKDLIKFINTTNNEKAFFAHKVILVEGISDLIVYRAILDKLANEMNNDRVVEVIEVGSKNNLFRFREFLNEWEIENYIIADLGYLKDVRKDKVHIVKNEDVKNKFDELNEEINSIIVFSDEELRNILCKNPEQDALAVVNLIKDKKNMTQEEFNQKMNGLCDYLIEQRTIKTDKTKTLPKTLDELLNMLSEREKILIVKNGSLEDIFPALNTSPANKVSNAIDVSEKIKVKEVPDYIKSFLTKIIT